MFFGIDHLVLAGRREDHRRLGERLVPHGFVPVPGRLRFDDVGAHSESYAYAGGGFLEVVYEVEPGRAPRAWFGGPLPRLMGIGVSSDAFEGDTAGWSWQMDEVQVLDDGTPHRIRAAGPHEHQSPLYLFAMDRPDRRLDHPGLGGTARLTELRFSGHEQWRERLERWLGRADAVGDVALRFAPGDGAAAAVSPVFAAPAPGGAVALAAGAIELSPPAGG